jgi:hypothetical protein
MRRSGHIRQRSPGRWELRYSLGTYTSRAQPHSRSIQCLGEWRPGATAKKAASSGSASFRECWNCHEPFVAGPKGNRRGDAKFCSDKCRIEFNSLQRSRKDR